MTSTRTQWIAYSMLLILGFLMIAGIIANSLNSDQDLRHDLRRYGVRVSGNVTDLRSARGSTNTAHMIFRTRDGTDVATSYGNGIDFPERNKLSAGMTVDIVYDPFDPKRAIPAPFMQVPLRDKPASLIAILARILINGGPILLLAFVFGKIFMGRTKNDQKSNEYLSKEKS